ncbi:MAG TPA: hypothetical protein VJN89_15315 [Candidatus Acidoferrum sp.]|nr:hypothetical protein [Candidatus Acidoferrum sp.]
MKQKAESRKQKAESRKQKAESRKQKESGGSKVGNGEEYELLDESEGAIQEEAT